MNFNEEQFNEKVFQQRYSMIKQKEIKEAVERYKQEADNDDKYLVLKSNVREDKKAKELYSLAKSFNNWKDAETYASTVTHSIIVDADKKCEVKDQQ